MAARLRQVTNTLDNRLYRVEVHDAGPLGKATFKWSQDNGAIAASVTQIHTTTTNDNQVTTITLSEAETGVQSRFAPNQWVEFSNEELTLNGLPGIFARLTAVSEHSLTVAAWAHLTPEQQAMCGDDWPRNLGTRPIVRRWDSPGTVPLDAPAATEGWIELEKGIGIAFEAGDYKTGDYWLIPTRHLTGQIDWPTAGPQSPPGIQHHYAPLAALRLADGRWTLQEDVRRLFSALTGGLLSKQGDVMTGSLRVGADLYVDDKVGIGTTNPNETLEVNGNALVTGNALINGSLTVDTRTLHVARGKNCVGIGTTDPKTTLDVDGDIITRGVGVGAQSRNGHWDTDGAFYRYNGQVYITVDDNLYIRDAKGANQMHFDTNNGRLGIGTTNPNEALDINGNALVNGSLTVDTKTLHVASGKNCVGIGTTEPKTTLDVDGDIITRGVGVGAQNRNGHWDTDGAFYQYEGQVYITVDDNLYIRDKKGSSQMHFDTNNGRLGIGTVNPESSLTVNPNIRHDAGYDKYGEAVLTLFEPTDNGGNNPNSTRDILNLVREGVAGEAYGNKVSLALGRYENRGTHSRSQLDIKLTDGQFNSHNAVLTLRSNGNVGIGTTEPGEKLDINGNALITGNALINGSLTVDTNTLHVASGRNCVGIGTTDPKTTLDVDGDIITRGVNVSNRPRDDHLDTDGAFYRHRGQAYITVDDNLYIRDKNGSIQIHFDTDNGRIGIGRTNPREALDISGKIKLHSSGGRESWMSVNDDRKALMLQLTRSHHHPNKTATIIWNGDDNWDFISDARLKTDIEDEEHILDRLMQLSVKNYRWKDNPEEPTKKLGFLAQDVQPLFPSMVGEMDDEETGEPTLTLKTGGFGVLAIGGLRELKREKDTDIAALRTMIETEVSRLNAEIEQLKG
jgi:hypothetical protein